MLRKSFASGSEIVDRANQVCCFVYCVGIVRLVFRSDLVPRYHDPEILSPTRRGNHGAGPCGLQDQTGGVWPIVTAQNRRKCPVTRGFLINHEMCCYIASQLNRQILQDLETGERNDASALHINGSTAIKAVVFDLCAPWVPMPFRWIIDGNDVNMAV
jgi:hypothetical protein